MHPIDQYMKNVAELRKRGLRPGAHGELVKVAKSKSAGQEREENTMRFNSVGEETIFKAAQSCPYRVIKLEDADTGEQLFP